jgi:hypothetical protein
MRGRVILSLCDLTGNWSRPYAEAGYEVRMVDLATGQDVRLLQYPDVPVHGILAAPPCTCFANSGAWVPRTDAEMIEALSVVDACLRLVAICNPTWWCLENPVGKLKKYLGPPVMRFNPCDYGDPYTKKTCLWGRFTPPVPDSLLTTTKSVEPVRVCSQGSWIQTLGGKSERTKRLRSATPPGFAKAFFEVNP